MHADGDWQVVEAVLSKDMVHVILVCLHCVWCAFTHVYLTVFQLGLRIR